MNDKLRYFICCDRDKQRLEEEVTSYLAEGWACQGGVSTSVEHMSLKHNEEEEICWFYQAMVRP